MNLAEVGFQVVDESVGSSYPIRPNNIKIEALGCVGFFGKFEVENVAGKLVSFFQASGRWKSFSILELVDFYRSKGWDPNFMFFGLCGVWYDDASIKEFLGNPWTQSPCYLVLGEDGKYRVTNHFIDRCAQEPR